MKRSPVLLFLLAGISLSAQDYVPLPTENVVWTHVRTLQSEYAGPSPETTKYAPLGDTLIGGTIYTKLYISTDSVFRQENAAYAGAYQNAGKKVFMVYPGKDQPELLYDFEIQPGDTLKLDDCESPDIEDCPLLYVTEVDEVTLSDGSRRRRIKMQGYFQGQNPDSLQWIEGIGSSWGFFNSYSNFFYHYLPVDPQVFVDLLCFEQEGELLYTWADFYEGRCYYPAGPINSVEEPSREVHFSCAPNPAGEYLEVIWKEELPSSPATYQAVGADGKVYLQVKVEGTRQRIALQELPAGWYVLRLLGAGPAAPVPFLKH